MTSELQNLGNFLMITMVLVVPLQGNAQNNNHIELLTRYSQSLMRINPIILNSNRKQDNEGITGAEPQGIAQASPMTSYYQVGLLQAQELN